MLADFLTKPLNHHRLTILCDKAGIYLTFPDSTVDTITPIPDTIMMDASLIMYQWEKAQSRYSFCDPRRPQKKLCLLLSKHLEEKYNNFPSVELDDEPIVLSDEESR